MSFSKNLKRKLFTFAGFALSIAPVAFILSSCSSQMTKSTYGLVYSNPDEQNSITKDTTIDKDTSASMSNLVLSPFPQINTNSIFSLEEIFNSKFTKKNLENDLNETILKFFNLYEGAGLGSSGTSFDPNTNAINKIVLKDYEKPKNGEIRNVQMDVYYGNDENPENRIINLKPAFISYYEIINLMNFISDNQDKDKEIYDKYVGDPNKFDDGLFDIVLSHMNESKGYGGLIGWSIKLLELEKGAKQTSENMFFPSTFFNSILIPENNGNIEMKFKELDGEQPIVQIPQQINLNYKLIEVPSNNKQTKLFKLEKTFKEILEFKSKLDLASIFDNGSSWVKYLTNFNIASIAPTSQSYVSIDKMLKIDLNFKIDNLNILINDNETFIENKTNLIVSAVIPESLCKIDPTQQPTPSIK